MHACMHACMHVCMYVSNNSDLAPPPSISLCPTAQSTCNSYTESSRYVDSLFPQHISLSVIPLENINTANTNTTAASYVRGQKYAPEHSSNCMVAKRKMPTSFSHFPAFCNFLRDDSLMYQDAAVLQLITSETFHRHFPCLSWVSNNLQKSPRNHEIA